MKFDLRPPSLAALGAGLLLSAGVYATDVSELEPVEPPPPPPPVVVNGEPIEPEVTIVQKKDAKVEEYRIHGKLFMVKITPIVGPAYYLRDNNGDGRMETRMNDLGGNIIVPQWVLFSWQ